ncbi:MAG: phosphoribosyl 1,2-cyclic phosphate phosphodiesterase [Dasania sp.]|jgi:phosphoribosyl 1,2-cyclic phosphate phosphodiesterase
MVQKQLTAIILGCGSSGGVPRINGNWGVCDPNNPKNIRTRSSMVIHYNNKHIVIDTSPEFRMQMIREKITSIEAVLYTHDHADQAHGIDDVRAYSNMGRDPIPCYADHETANILGKRFDYIFHQKPDSDYPAVMTMHKMTDYQPFQVQSFGDIDIIAFEAPHGKIVARGFIIGSMAYSPDVSGLSDAVLDRLKGCDIWVVDCLRYRPHDTHANLEQVLKWHAYVQPKQMILTNLHIDFDYDILSQELPDNIIPAYDGLRFNFNA